MASPSTIVAYHEQQVTEFIHRWNAQQLLELLQTEPCFRTLHQDETTELSTLLKEWEQRALGLITIHDAMWVDPRRGLRVYHLLYTASHAALEPLPKHPPTMFKRSLESDTQTKSWRYTIAIVVLVFGIFWIWKRGREREFLVYYRCMERKSPR